jgi:hypothetical protein
MKILGLKFHISIIINCIIVVALTSIAFNTFGQTNKGILYKSDHWADLKGKGDWAKAWDNPTYEKVEILKTDKNIKVTFGAKVYNYSIISSNKSSDVLTQYTTTLNGNTYIISIADMMDGTYSLSIDNIWQVIVKNNDITTIDV